jgi:hypothetical protein
LRSSGLAVLVIAAVPGVAAYLLGRPPWMKRAWTSAARASADRGQGSQLDWRVAGHADTVRLGGIAVGVVVLFLTGIDWAAGRDRRRARRPAVVVGSDGRTPQAPTQTCRRVSPGQRCSRQAIT